MPRQSSMYIGAEIPATSAGDRLGRHTGTGSAPMYLALLCITSAPITYFINRPFQKFIPGIDPFVGTSDHGTEVQCLGVNDIGTDTCTTLAVDWCQ
uniref:Uncharacterized protein n=1 Tax=Oryza sativa subsp. japonica TaxID=39947 RepID=Q2QSU9_ORYSJ|nr:hypothetical protein LOC_Os12g22860 [Oryza sativa Japonica Group]